MMRHKARTAIALGAAAALFAPAPTTLALDEPPGEMAALKACEERACTMILDKASAGDDLKCGISKTWAQSSIKNGEQKGISWGFGDAHCTVNVKLSRADIIAALTKPEHTINSPPLAVTCEVEREDKLLPVTARAAPKLVFKNGKANKVWINLKELDGPDDIKGTIWVAANLEDSIGIFHKSLIKSINKFIYKRCPKNYGPEAEATDKRAAGKSEARAPEGGKGAVPAAGAKQSPPIPAAANATAAGN